MNPYNYPRDSAPVEIRYETQQKYFKEIHKYYEFITITSEEHSVLSIPTGQIARLVKWH